MRKTLINSLIQGPLTEPPPPPDEAGLAELAKKVDRAARAKLGRSLSIRQVDAGSCNGCELEIHALSNAFYDLERLGLRFVASPRHADVFLVCGPVTRPVVPHVKRLWEATPDPKLVFAVGSCACGGGVWFDTYNVVGGADKVLPVNFYIPGCPPRPEAIVYGVALALGVVPKKIAARYLSDEFLEEYRRLNPAVLMEAT